MFNKYTLSVYTQNSKHRHIVILIILQKNRRIAKDDIPKTDWTTGDGQ